MGMARRYHVVPILAGVAVWATYALGASVAGPSAGLIAALLLALSPVFGFILAGTPMSDIPAMAAWAVGLCLLGRSTSRSAFLAGVATGVAILIRPNMVVLAIVPGAFLLWRAMSDVLNRAAAVRRLLLFVIGMGPACLLIGALNSYWCRIAAGVRIRCAR